MQYALFAAYHLSLETSYLNDEGATVPKIPSDLQLEKQNSSLRYNQQNLNEFETIEGETFGSGCIMPCLNGSANQSHSRDDTIDEEHAHRHSRADLNQEEYAGGTIEVYPYSTKASIYGSCIPPVCMTVQTPKSSPASVRKKTQGNLYFSHNGHIDEAGGGVSKVHSDFLDSDNGWNHISDEDSVAIRDHNGNHNEYFPTSDSPQSILVSLSIACPLRGIVCKQSQLFRIKFYGTFDKPLGRYFREDLFVQVVALSSIIC